MINNFDKFYTMIPMKYYDCGGAFNKPKAQAMLKNESNNYIATRKNDGEWCRIIKNTNGETIAQSRTISKVTGDYGDKTEHIYHIIEEMNYFPPETVLIGELCFEDITKTSKDVGTILRCKPDKAIARQKDIKLVFKVFDCLAMEGIDLSEQPYYQRFMIAQDAIKDYGHNYISLTDFVLNDDFEDFLQSILAAGGEGIVIHKKDAKYKPGARTAWDSLKVKKIVEELELPVVDFIAPNKTYCGEDSEVWKYWIGIDNQSNQIIKLDHTPSADEKSSDIKWEPVTKPYWMGWFNGIVVNNNGTLVRVTSGLTDEDREWLTTEEAINAKNNGQLIASISAMEIVKKTNSLRHPRLLRLRTDI